LGLSLLSAGFVTISPRLQAEWREEKAEGRRQKAEGIEEYGFKF
jgi:hypothetical protein